MFDTHLDRIVFGVIRTLLTQMIRKINHLFDTEGIRMVKKLSDRCPGNFKLINLAIQNFYSTKILRKRIFFSLLVCGKVSPVYI